jgi:calcium-dependent protein kinase
VILYILITGSPPFNGKNDREILKKVEEGNYNLNHPSFSSVTPECKDLLQKMLTYDQKKRPSAYECYQHPWFKKENSQLQSKLDLQTLQNFKSFHVRFPHLYFDNSVQK